MGAKTWILVYADGDPKEILGHQPPLDRAAAAELVARLFPAVPLDPIADGDLSFTSPYHGIICAGVYPGVSVVAAEELGIEYPSKLDNRFLLARPSRTTYLHAMHSVVDWFAYGIWDGAKLRRSLSITPADGVIEDIGPKLDFEQPFWAGKHPARSTTTIRWEYPLPFHPLELGEAALENLFGFNIEGDLSGNVVDAHKVPLCQFKPRKPWWRFW